MISGLIVEETSDRLVLKTAEGQRIALRASEIEAKQMSEVSLMPESLAQAMTEQELVDAAAFLSTLKKPVSILGQTHAVGPAQVDTGPTTKKTDTKAEVKGSSGSLPWRTVSANAEGVLDLSPLAGAEPGKFAFVISVVTWPLGSRRHARYRHESRRESLGRRQTC